MDETIEDIKDELIENSFEVDEEYVVLLDKAVEIVEKTLRK